jgi:dTDP-4-dehydrorhamnose reductase
MGSPTYTPDLAQALIELARAGAAGVAHFANAGGCTRHEFALRIVRMAGLADGLAERPQRWSELGRRAPRPANSTLSSARFTALTSRTPRPWEEALAEHLAALPQPGRTRPGRAGHAGGRTRRDPP